MVVICPSDCGCRDCERQWHDEIKKWVLEHNLGEFDQMVLSYHVPVRFLRLPSDRVLKKSNRSV